MNLRDFRRAGHWPTLLTSTIYFGLTSAIWVLLGGLANSIGDEFHLSDLEKGLLVAVPSLGGAFMRLALGILTDRIGAKRTGMLSMVLTMVPLLLGWQWVDSYNKLLLVALLLGIAGASFAVALPLTSRWYPSGQQGLTMGIVGLGNLGTVVALLLGPSLADSIGWRGVFGAAIIPTLLMLVLFAYFAKDSPNRPAPKKVATYLAVMLDGDTWRFCLFYGITFGGYVGLASFLSIYYHSQYGLSDVNAGLCATLSVFVGALIRPVGGYLADRIGGITLLTAIFAGVGLLLLDLSTTPPLVWTIVLSVAIMGMLGLGNGAVFQLVPQRFSQNLGVVTGIVGAAGGVGGFILPTLLGSVRHVSGSFSGGFLLLAVISFVSIGVLVVASQKWGGVFFARSGLASSEHR